MVEITQRPLTDEERTRLLLQRDEPVRAQYRTLPGCGLAGGICGAVCAGLLAQWLERHGWLGGSAWAWLLLVGVVVGALGAMLPELRLGRQAAVRAQTARRTQATELLAGGTSEAWHVRATAVASVDGEWAELRLWVFDVGGGQLLALGGPDVSALVAGTDWPVDEFTLDLWPDGEVASVTLSGQPLRPVGPLTEQALIDHGYLIDCYYDGWLLFRQPRLLAGQLETCAADLAAWVEAYDEGAERQSWGGEGALRVEGHSG